MIPNASRATNTQRASTLSGAGLLGLITTGMYDDPLSIYREYIQNAADAAAASAFASNPRVDIALDVIRRQIKIRDYGPGLSHKEALERLLPIGRSEKRLGKDRGFRGIGRLAGLAFAQTVSFATRAHGDESVTRITWHRDRLPELNSAQVELDQAILDCVDVEALPGSNYPERFFDVEIVGVARHSVGLLLNHDAVRDYVSEVCPVPMSKQFRFAKEFDALFNSTDIPLTLEIWLDGDVASIERPYRESLRLSINKQAEFTDCQVVRIPSVDDTCDAAVGWIAHSSYLGAIPREQRVRGIRARVGNIQIGGNAIFDDLFVEERFNRWCVGELHILDPRIVPNARRDYFQPGPHLRNLENQLSPLFRDISARCRRESTARNRARRTLSTLCSIEDSYALASSGFLTVDDSIKLAHEALREVTELRERARKGDLDNDTLQRIANVEHRLTNLPIDTQPEHFGASSSSEIAIYQRVFSALVTLAPSPSSARELIQMVFAEVSRVATNGLNGPPHQGAAKYSDGRQTTPETGADLRTS